jgi:predicted CxxxxCH...CXXCH cytochrome family protein
MNPSYVAGTKTCNNTYCHAGVQIKDLETGIVTYQGSKPNPTWNDAGYLGGTGCTMCHGYPPRGNHPNSTACSACHSHVDESNLTMRDKTKHMDGTVEVTVDNCLDCHSSYNTCAENDPTCVNKKLVGGHLTHTNSELFLAGKRLSAGDYIDSTWIYGITYKKGFPQYACGFCHPMNSATHKNGIVEIDLDPSHALRGSVKTRNKAVGPWVVSYNPNQSVVCNNVYCHSSGFVSDTTQQYQFKQTPDWYYADQHGGTSYWANVDRCAQCHGNSPNTGGTEGSTAHARHVVANHYKDVFDNYSAKLKPSGAPGSGVVHGDPATATNLNCNICHFNTVRVNYNDKGSVCINCHATTPKGSMEIYSSSSTHVNGDVDVVFMEPFNFKSKAQIRNPISSVQSVYTSWTRVKGYKTYSSYDLARRKPQYVGGTCLTASCHNGTQMEWRTKGPLACAA